MQIDVDWFWLMLIGGDWCFLMPIDYDGCWLILIDADWCWLMLIDAGWCWLMLIGAQIRLIMFSFSERTPSVSPVIFATALGVDVSYCLVWYQSCKSKFSALWGELISRAPSWAIFFDSVKTAWTFITHHSLKLCIVVSIFRSLLVKDQHQAPIF